MKESIIQIKSKKFSVRIIRLYKMLIGEQKEFIISKQVLRSGTSIGANIAEAYFGQNRKDFINKMQIALKETAETKYWLELLDETEFVNKNLSTSLLEDCTEIGKLLHSTVKTTKQAEK